MDCDLKERTWVIGAAIIIIMYMYHALINAPSAHMMQINLNTVIFYTNVTSVVLPKQFT